MKLWRYLWVAMASDPKNSHIPDFAIPVMVDSSRCASETLGDETLVIDTVSGTLYVLRGLGATVWVALTKNAARPSLLVEQATERFGSEVGDALGAMLEGLSELFVAGSGETPVVDWPQKAEPPTFERFDDIADILTLDPIHDVQSDAGWPFEPKSEDS
jgi:hypothetical protein